MENSKEISKLKDKELLEKFGVLVQKEKEATASVVAHLAEIDRRKLYAQEGYSSLFTYCVQKYHYSEGAAYRRIQGAKVYQKFPYILELLKEGKVNLMALSLIEPHLNLENGKALLNRIIGKSKREVEEILSQLSLKEEKTKDIIRRLPLKRAIPEETAQNFTFTGESESCEDVSQKKPGAPIPQAFSDTAKTEIQEIRRVKIEFCASENLAKKIQRAKEILRHTYPQGRLEDIFEEALELLLEKKDPERKIKRMETKALKPRNFEDQPVLKDNAQVKNHAERQSPEASSLRFPALRAQDDNKTRYIPQFLQREVYKRDEGKCSYVSPEGKPCGEKNFLELDHVKPFALGGKTTEENLRLLCRSHNQFRAEKTFGE